MKKLILSDKLLGRLYQIVVEAGTYIKRTDHPSKAEEIQELELIVFKELNKK